jgi:hypothetical protein
MDLFASRQNFQFMFPGKLIPFLLIIMHFHSLGLTTFTLFLPYH